MQIFPRAPEQIKPVTFTYLLPVILKLNTLVASGQKRIIQSLIFLFIQSHGSKFDKNPYVWHVAKSYWCQFRGLESLRPYVSSSVA
jgi:hypothetical protein